MIHLMIGDCIERMEDINDGSIDVTITSPPYNIGNSIGGGKYKNYKDNMKQNEYCLWLVRIIDILLNKSNLIFFNIQMLSSNKETVLFILGKYKNKIKDIIIWNKNQCSPAICPGVMNSKFEFIIIFSNDEPQKRNFKKSNIKHNFNNVIEGNNAGSNKFSKDHIATFPEYIPYNLIYAFSKENDLIFDPFMGTGTTGKMAKKLNRNFIGIELDKECFEIAKIKIGTYRTLDSVLEISEGNLIY